MVKASLLLMLLLTVLIGMGLRWRENRLGNPALTAERRARQQRMGLVARGKAGIDRWVTAAAIAAVATIVLIGGLHWIRVWFG
ncbi:hypothetical protein [Pseudoroseomonas ludipueritiae]|uniref:Uncharacterized protein n=1 Tax=Pseudoroseomonas ludipueritiae TaxID=198093 RepID=A0ABR7R9F5_9PROT|nr:hypothetical protein [Pseudoroseomonas ludipueritiae]MBC9178444.1 hypothetical protein [Pseudoroseomonas ludipueritiae]MCG7364478.1 hypothetical protein [Roseomonas sp. ACRSG]